MSAVEEMERNGTAVPRRNPMFAILGLSHIGNGYPGVSRRSSSLSVSCFGRFKSKFENQDDEKTDVRPPRLTQHSSDDAVIRKHSTTAGRRHIDTSVDRRPSKLPPPTSTNSLSSLEVPTVSCDKVSRRPSCGDPTCSSLASESLIIRPLRGSACSNSFDWQSMRPEAAGSKSRVKTACEPSAHQDVRFTGYSELRETSSTAGRHLNVFLPSLMARQIVELDD